MAELVRCELARLTALLRRHFSPGGQDSLLAALADISDPAATAGARAFLDQISDLAAALQRHASDWSASPSVADASADFRRETMAVLRGVEDRLEERKLQGPMQGPMPG